MLGNRLGPGVARGQIWPLPSKGLRVGLLDPLPKSRDSVNYTDSK